MLLLFIIISFLVVVTLARYWYSKADADLTLLRATLASDESLNVKFKDKVVWITGASSGIGEEIAYQLALYGAKLVLSGTRADALERVRGNCLTRGAPKVKISAFDVADFASHPKLLEGVIEEFGRVDVMVNNAGRLLRSEFIKGDLEQEKKLFDVNVFGIMSLTRLMVKHWLESGQAKPHLFVTSSVAGKMGSPFSSCYAASKHALHGYLETLRDELSCMESSICLTIGCPGPVRSNLRANASAMGLDKEGVGSQPGDSNSARKLMETSRCAQLIVAGIAHDLDELWIAQQPILLLMYVYQYLPSTFRRYLLRHVMTKKQVEAFRKEK